MASQGSPLVFSTVLFRQIDGVNSLVRRLYLAITARLVPTE